MIYVAFLDDGHGMKTAGKETPYIQKLGRRIKENEFNRAVVKALKVELERNGVLVYEVAPTDDDTPLVTRTNFANATYAALQRTNGKNGVTAIYVSIHYDALDGKFDGPGKDPEGITVFVYTGNTTKNSGKLARNVLEQLAQGTPQKNRGVKEADFHVLRETDMPAILTENGFMDNEREALLMADAAFQKEAATEHAKGICAYFGIKYKGGANNVPTPGPQKPTEPKKPDYIGHWAEKSIEKAMKKSIMSGYADGNFGPNDPVTRGQLAAIMDRLKLLD